MDLNVVEIMKDEFERSETTKRVLPIAHGVEESAKAILLCQSQIRRIEIQTTKYNGCIKTIMECSG